MTWRPLEAKPEPVRLDGVLDQVARTAGLPASSVLKSVFGRWDEIVGTGVADHAQPLSLVDGKLVIAVDQPGWATQVRYLSSQIVTRVNDIAGPGAVEEIHVRVRP